MRLRHNTAANISAERDGSYQPQSVARIQPTPQAVGPTWNDRKPRRGERTVATELLKLGFFVLGLSLALWAQGQSASLAGTVRDPHGTPLSGVTVELYSATPQRTFSAKTDTKGGYKYSSIPEGSYELRAHLPGFEDARIPSVFVAPNQSKAVDVVLRSASASSAAQPQFFDTPDFTVAGVTDTTSLGGHGSDAIVRTRENLAKDTVSLGKDTRTTRSGDVEIERSATAAADREPSNFEANFHAGEILLRNTHAAAAIPYLKRAVDLRPSDYEAAYQLALANWKAGNYAVARAIGSDLIKSRDTAELHHFLGDVDERLGDSLASVHHYQRAAELKPDETYLFDWGSELLLHHAPEPAEKVFSRGARAFPRSARMLVGLGAALFARGASDDAARTICQAADLDPNDAAPYIFLGKLQRSQTSASPEIVERLRRFVTLQPQNAQANYFYAVALAKAQKHEPANSSAAQIEHYLLHAVELDPGFALAHLQLGITRADRGDFAAAVTDYQRAISADPDLEEAHYRLMQAYRKLGKPEDARRELSLYEQSAAKAAATTERERHEIRQFVYTLRDQPTVPANRP